MSLPILSQNITLEKTRVNKEITVLIPENMSTMSQAQRIQKYVSNREPVAMYHTEDGRVDFGININSSNWTTGDYDILRQFYRSGILNLYDDVDFYRDTIQNIHDRKYISFEFRGTLFAKEDSFRKNQSLSKYVYICYTLKDNRVLLFNFSAPYALRHEWRPVADEIMQSIKIK